MLKIPVNIEILLMVCCLLFSASTLANFDAKNKKHPESDRCFLTEFTVENGTQILSNNSQPVGLTGSEVKAKILILKNGKKDRVSIFFDSKVLVNSYGIKGCLVSTCNVEVKFDNGRFIKFKVYESRSDMYLQKIDIKDNSFVEKIKVAKKIQIKIRFADAIDGFFVFTK